MKRKLRFSRRNLLSLTAATGVAAVAGGETTGGVENKPQDKPRSPASEAIRLIADRIVQWQTPSGDLGRRCPFGGGGHLSYPFLAVGMYDAYKATRIEAYKASAAGSATFYLSIMSPVWHTAHFGLALRGLQILKLCRPGWTQWNAKATALVDWMLPWRWDEPTYFRMGYGSVDMADAAPLRQLGCREPGRPARCPFPRLKSRGHDPPSLEVVAVSTGHLDRRSPHRG